MNSKPSTCQGCPAYQGGRSYVPGIGPSDARIAIVGQGPGRDEANGVLVAGRTTFRPFVGRSGAKLDRWFEMVNLRRERRGQRGIARSDVWIDNVVRCWLTSGTKDRAPSLREVSHCTRAHLLPALTALPDLKVVVAVGVPAMRWLFGPQATEGFAGHTQHVDLTQIGDAR